MPTIEQVCKRLFSGPTWFLKCIIGALLMVVPVAHFFAFGYLYELVARARRGDSLDFPEWDDWRRMFVNGIPAFIIFLVLGALPLGLGWLLTLPLRFLGYGVFVYLPMVPAVLLAMPLTAAGIYQYQKREEYRDAFRIWLLVSMIRSSRARFLIPTFAVAGFVITVYPLMTFTIFVALAVGWSFYAAFFRAVEESRKTATRTT
jgi:F0F1-type ATP synthase assembly protein I